MNKFLVVSFACAVALVPAIAGAQQGSGCSMSEPPLKSNKPNIFTDQQEQWLGDAQANQLESEYDLLPQKDSAELERIGQKLLSQLPPTPIPYHFRVYDSDEANGFSVAGGYVYISRKLITDARSEDEVAGVISHEIGHIYTHQVAIEYTRDLKAMMSVTSLEGQADVSDKMQLLLNAPWKEGADESEDEQEKNELLADRVGMYALIKAGYAPRALAENLDRIAANKGHTGNFLTDALGATSDISRRVRTARKVASSLPEGCGRMAPGSSPEFKAFQDAVRGAPIHPLIDPTAGLSSVKLDPPMRPALEQVRFSPDGKLVVAQDETSIHVLSRSPAKLLFSIDAPGAHFAHFTPDSTHVVFHFPSMRVENWDVASGKRESYHELVSYEGCGQTSLAPDGKTFVCISKTYDGVWLKLIDVDSGKLVLDDKRFYQASFDQAIEIIYRFATEPGVASIRYSQDGHTMVLATGTKAIAYDLVNRKMITLGKDLSHLLQGRMAFVDSDKLVYECDWDSKEGGSHDTFKMCESTFPDGTPINTFKVGYQWLEQVTHGSRVLIGPFKDNAAMLADPSTSKAVAGFKLDSVDLYDQMLASENEHGGVTIGELGAPHMDSVDLPMGPMASVTAAAFSPDGRFLAYSGRSRSSIWDLTTQKRVALMRPFRSVRFDDDNQMYAQYQESHQKPGQNFHIDLKTGKATEGSKYSVDQLQYGDVLVNFQPMEKTGTTSSNVLMQVSDPITGAALWNKRFPHETPLIKNTDDGSLLLITDLTEQTATDESVHAGAKLVKTSDRRGEWVAQGLHVEILSSRTGEIRREVELPVRRHGAMRDGRTADLFGDYLVVRGNYNNSVVYRVSDGVRIGSFFGRTIAADPKAGLLAATNRDQEVTIYNLANCKELNKATVDHLPRAARFIQGEKKLLVLTASQRVYTIDAQPMDRAAAETGH